MVRENGGAHRANVEAPDGQMGNVGDMVAEVANEGIRVQGNLEARASDRLNAEGDVGCGGMIGSVFGCVWGTNRKRMEMR